MVIVRQSLYWLVGDLVGASSISHFRAVAWRAGLFYAFRAFIGGQLLTNITCTVQERQKAVVLVASYLLLPIRVLHAQFFISRKAYNILLMNNCVCIAVVISMFMANMMYGSSKPAGPLLTSTGILPAACIPSFLQILRCLSRKINKK